MDTHKISFRTLTSSGGLAKNSFIVFAGTMAANILSYLYHLIMGRALGPAGYGELSSLLSILYIFTIPILVTQTVLIKFISGFKAKGESGKTKGLVLSSIRLFGIVSLVGLPIVLACTQMVTNFLHLSSNILFVLAYVFLVVSIFTSVGTSVITGYQRFVWVSIMAVSAVCVKLLMSIPLARFGVLGVMVAGDIAGFIALSMFVIPLRFLHRVRKQSAPIPASDTIRFALPTLLAQLGITSLFSTDIILVRHFFNTEISGIYAALAILGKIIFYASSAIPTVLFPIASERAAMGAKTKNLVLTAMIAVAAISVMLTGIYALYPKLIIGLLFGKAFQGGESLLGLFGLFICFYSIANIVMLACLAVNRLRIWIFPVVASVAQVVAIAVVHDTIGHVVLLNTVIACILAVCSITYYAYEKI